MKHVRLTHPYKVNEIDRKNCPTDADVSCFLIEWAVRDQYPNGMPRTDSRFWARINRKLEDASDTLPLEELEFMWLYERMEKREVIPVGISQWYWLFMEYLDSIKGTA